MYCMRNKDFEVKTVEMNGNKVRVRIPKRTISEDKFKRKLYEIFKRHA